MKIAVLGAGNFGLALATLLCDRHHDVSIWVRNPEFQRFMAIHKKHPQRLTLVTLPASLKSSHILEDVVSGSELIVTAVPMLGLRELLLGLKNKVPSNAIILGVTKGIEVGTHLFPSEILAEILPERASSYAYLSGPSFAEEVALGKMTAVSLAAPDSKVLQQVSRVFAGSDFYVETLTDVRGLEVCSAIKNIAAIASGVIHGLGLGANTQAAFTVLALREMRVALGALGGDLKTVDAFGGVGDLVLTCYGQASRNRAIGIQLAQGHFAVQPSELSAHGEVAEGVHASLSVVERAQKVGLELPICEAVKQMLFDGARPYETLQSLFKRGG